MPIQDEAITPKSSQEEIDSTYDGGEMIGKATPSRSKSTVKTARASFMEQHLNYPLPAREAEEFLVPSWTAGAIPETAQKGPNRNRKRIREIVETVLLALLVFLAVRVSLQNYLVEGYSMFPTLDHGQHILVNKLVYAEINMDRLTDIVPFADAEDDDIRQLFGKPQRGDIIVFKSSAGSGNDLIKRVIGLPGEQVDIIQGLVYIDGHLLNEPYIKEPWNDTHSPIVVPPRHYYVLGDNRNSSQDSRSARVGLVPRERIVGKALLRYWPFGDFGLPQNGGAELTATTLERAEGNPR